MPTSTLLELHPPGGDFLLVQKGTKDTPKRGDFDFPPLRKHPLETTKHKGGLRPPLLEVTPQENETWEHQRRNITRRGKLLENRAKIPLGERRGASGGNWFPPGRHGAEGMDIPQNVPAPWPPFLAFFWVGYPAQAQRKRSV